MKNLRLNLFSKIRAFKWLRLVLPVVLLMAVLGFSATSLDNPNRAKGQESFTPRFNFLPGDLEMLRASTEADRTWNDPINANVGDRVAFLIYYHNGIVNSTAHNTQVKVELPSAQSDKLVANASIWSDETAPITDTIVDGNVVGPSGATVNLPSSAQIEYLPGSTRWFPNGTQTPQVLPDGITTTGVNIGEIKGCWQYAGFVTFVAEIKGPAKLVLDKTVAHPGDTVWHKEISANPGDDIAYHLGIRNDGGLVASDVLIKDTLPSYMSYTAGSTYIYTKDHPEGIRQADSLFSNGISISSIAPGSEGIIYITYRTKISIDMPTGAFTLVNLAKMFSNGSEQGQDQAKVNISTARGLTIDKEVSNGVSWVEQNSGELGGNLSYRIVIKNTGNVTLSSVSVRDALPVFVKYIPGSTRVDGAIAGDEIVSNGILIGSLNPGEAKTITLDGTIYGCPPIGSYALVNTAYTKADSVSEISDSAITVTNVAAPFAPILIK